MPESDSPFRRQRGGLGLPTHAGFGDPDPSVRLAAILRVLAGVEDPDLGLIVIVVPPGRRHPFRGSGANAIAKGSD
jgi:hypothetical protein